MKQIDIIKTYGQKRCLIVDDNPDVRTSLKRVLVDFGCNDVDTAGHAEEAIELCERHHYDIVLADYNLGNGKNGQQLLEELRYHQVLKNTAIYIMITAESAVQHVIHALEFQPDDYLNKPINREALRPRLDAALLKNEALLSINDALDIQSPKKAIHACRKLIQEKDKYQNDAKKMLGELLCKEKEYEQALDVFTESTESASVLWVRLGQAKAYIGLNKIDEAEALLLEVIAENQYCVDAHDLMAQVYEARKKYQKAYMSLTTAVELSPMSALRQRELGRISIAAEEFNAAAHAYRAAIKNSKNSCRESPEDYIELAEVLGKMLNGQVNTKELTREALETLNLLDKRYSKQPLVQMRKHLVKAFVYTQSDNARAVEKANNEAITTFNNLKLSVVENTSPKLSIDCAKALMSLGKYDEGELLLQEVASFNTDKKMAISIDKLLREPITKEGRAYAAKLNKRGISYHEQNQFDQAITSFKKVLSELPNHVGLNLNLIQSTLSKGKETELSEQEISQMASSFQRIGEMQEDSAYKKRFDYLIKRYQKLTNS